MTCPAQIITRSGAVLLDFDGPVCAVFGGLSNRQVASELRDLFEGKLPDTVDRSRDPFDVLKYAANLGDFASQVERRLRELETRAVAVAPSTPGAIDVLALLRARGTPVVIVSNNSEVAIEAYLETHDLTGMIAGISARTSADVEKLKPRPYLLRQAMSLINVPSDACVMVGDSVTDIEAAQHVGVSVIAYANKPGKRAQFEQCGPAAIIDQMSELTL